MGVGVADDELRFQRLQHICAAGVGGGQHGRVKQIHVCVGNVLDGDKALQLVLVIDDAERVDFHIAHQVPGGAQAHFAVNAGLLADVDIFNLRADIGTQARRLDAEMLQNKFRLAIDVPGAAGLIQAGQAAAVFQPRIGQRGADGVRVRVLVTNDIDVAHRICHSGSPHCMISVKYNYNILYYSTLFCVLRFLTN